MSWLGALQAQEYGPARWALGLRLAPEITDAEVAAAFDAGRLLRTHVLRPTWHFVPPEDLRWLTALTAPRIRGSLRAYDRTLEIDASLLRRARRVIEHALVRHPERTRAELAVALADAGIVASGQRLAQLVMHAELDALVCSGPRRDRQFTYALVDRRVPRATPLTPEESLETLVVRFFRSHGPATLRDFTWWCGLRMTDARRVLEARGASSCDVEGLRYWWIEADLPAPDDEEPRVHLLPIYDEYTVAYRDRAAVPLADRRARARSTPAIVHPHALVIDGRIAGTWRPAAGRGATRLDIRGRRRFSAPERQALAHAVARYGRFMGTPAQARLE